MRRLLFLVLAALSVLPLDMKGKDKEEKPSHIKMYGFIRNYFAFDSRENKAGTKDLFFYLPKDESLNSSGEDINAQPSFRFLAITSRLGVDVKDYQFGKTKVGAKVETDFYCMNGNVAVLRLRQAYALMSWDNLGRNQDQSVSFKVGQAWHPLAADQPYVIDLETGTPFNPFSRTPLAVVDYNFGKRFTFSGGIIYQMQYLSSGPSGPSDNYLKYSCVPEIYAGLSVKSDGGFLARAGMDVLSIKPRWKDALDAKVSDRITTVNPYVYAQYSSGSFAVNGKFVYGSAGEHINLLSGYGISAVNSDGSYEYTPLHSAVSYVSARYGRKVQIQGMVGYIQNLGTSTALAPDIVDSDGTEYTKTGNLYISGNGYHNLNRLIRVTPTVVYNLGKLAFALEYDITSAQYGTYQMDGYVKSSNGLVDSDLHWVTNHRLLAMVKFTF